MLDNLRDLMYRCINTLGPEDEITVAVSQRLDEEIVKEHKGDK